MIQVRNAPDRRDSSGAWLRSYRESGIRYHTLSGCIWNCISTRTKVGGSFQNKHETYLGVTNSFTSFQEFCDWCQEEPGYGLKDLSGEAWGLDKDIIGAKAYSKESCMFVPKLINNFILDNPKSRSDLPIGVSRARVGGGFRARIKLCGKELHLGTFSTQDVAHRAWVVAKVSKAEDYIREYSWHKKLVAALERYIKEIEYGV